MYVLVGKGHHCGVDVTTSDDDACSTSLSSAASSKCSDFITETDFANAVARAAENAGYRVDGSVITNPNAGTVSSPPSFSHEAFVCVTCGFVCFQEMAGRPGRVAGGTGRGLRSSGPAAHTAPIATTVRLVLNLIARRIPSLSGRNRLMITNTVNLPTVSFIVISS